MVKEYESRPFLKKSIIFTLQLVRKYCIKADQEKMKEENDETKILDSNSMKA